MRHGEGLDGMDVRPWSAGTAFTGILLILGIASLGQARGGIDEGLAFLAANQQASGTWGANAALELRDTATVLETLRRYGRVDASFQRGRSVLRGSSLANVDLEARASVVESTMPDGSERLGSLWAGRRPRSFDATDTNYPEGGWGIAPGFQTDTLDTALALQAFAAGGYAKGLTRRGEVLATSLERVYTMETRSDAISASALFPALSIAGGSGSLNVWFVGPGGRFPTSGWWVVTSPNTIITWGASSTPPFAAGPIEVHVRNDAASSGAATFDIELSFVANGINSRDLVQPVEYLRATRNAGTGWGVVRGAPTDLNLSLHVLAALQVFDRAFANQAVLGPGLTWLKNQANGDGGFGSGPGSTAFETALAYIVLAGENPATPQAASARNWLVTRQLGDGSWNGSAYETALAVKALSWGDPDADGDLVRDTYDNCDAARNIDQLDTDGDASGDDCDADDDNDGVADGGSVTPSRAPFQVRDITTMTGTLPQQPPNSFINFQALGTTSDNLGWWDARNRSWIDAGVAPVRKNLAFYVDTNACGCIDINAGATLTPATDNGIRTIFLPNQPPGWQGWLYVATDGSTYFDSALTALAQGPPPVAGDNCRVDWNPQQYDRDGDGTGDACDPDDGEVEAVWMLADAKSIAWQPEAGALGYNVYRGMIASLSATNYGSCWASGLLRDADLDGNPDATDPQRPAAGSGYFYLVTAEMPSGEGSLGRNSAGGVRPNSTPCP